MNRKSGVITVAFFLGALGCVRRMEAGDSAGRLGAGGESGRRGTAE